MDTSSINGIGRVVAIFTVNLSWLSTYPQFLVQCVSMKLLLRRACPCCWHDQQQHVLSLCSAVSVFFAPMRIPVRIGTMTLERNIFPPKWCVGSKVVIIISHRLEINQAKLGGDFHLVKLDWDVPLPFLWL